MLRCAFDSKLHSTHVLHSLAHQVDIDAQDPHMTTALHYAAFNGRAAIVRILVRAGADVTLQDEEERTALVLASMGGHASIVEMLIGNGAPIECPNRWQQTPVTVAAMEGRTECVELLVGAGANVEAVDARGCRALLKAAEYGHAGAAAILVQQGGARSDVRNDKMQTPLIACARNGHADAARVIAEAGADLTLLEPGSKLTALQIAQELRHDGVVAALQDAAHGFISSPGHHTGHGFTSPGEVGEAAKGVEDGKTGEEAETPQPLDEAPLGEARDDRSGDGGDGGDGGRNTKRKSRRSSVSASAPPLPPPLLPPSPQSKVGEKTEQPPPQLSMTELAKKHLGELATYTRKVEKEAAEQPEDSTSLAVASQENGVSNDMALIEECSRPRVDPLLCEELIAKGVDVNHQDGHTALTCVAKGGHTHCCLGQYRCSDRCLAHTSIVRQLLAAGARADTQETNGKSTALCLAARHGNLAIIEALVESKAGLDVQDCDGCTALHVAIAYGHADVAKVLIRHGASIGVRDNDGMDAGQLAKEKGQTKIQAMMKVASVVRSSRQ